MKLLTKAILRKLAPLGTTQDAEDPFVPVKFFTPDGGWTWYVTEAGLENDDFIFVTVQVPASILLDKSSRIV